MQPISLHFFPTPLGQIGEMPLDVFSILANADLILAENPKKIRSLLREINTNARNFFEKLLSNVEPKKTIDLASHLIDSQIYNKIVSFSERDSDDAIDKFVKLCTENKWREMANLFWQNEKDIETFTLSFQNRTDPFRLVQMSDNGLAFVEDPGLRLMRLAAQHQWHVQVFPGPSAVTVALGYIPHEFTSFHFMGFLPRNKEGNRILLLKQWATQAKTDSPFLFYETPHRLPALLNEIVRNLPSTIRLGIVYEMATPVQSVWFGTVHEMKNRLDHWPKGRAVIMLLGNRK